MLLKSVLLLLFGVLLSWAQNAPNIIIFLIDDAGWNDFGYHGSNNFPTSNIDALAYTGVILNNHYAQPICTPSRAALMTGIYPYKLGMTTNAVEPTDDWGLPLNLTTLPQYLKQLGYSNHMLGKWHLGSCSEVYTPTFRGFDSYYGLWNGYSDYYNRELESNLNDWVGYDFRSNMDVEWGRQGEYFTRILGEEAVSLIQQHNESNPLFLYFSHMGVHVANPDDPFQAPQETIDQFDYISDTDRRTFAAMAWEVDDTVGKVFEALYQKQMLNNTIILLTSDNGGASAGPNTCGGYNTGSNWPLRGEKCTTWEGGVKATSFVWSPLLLNPGRVSSQMIHLTDWLPTLISAAGLGNITLDGIDGLDIWSSLVDGSPSPREEFPVEIYPSSDTGAIRDGDWKLVIGPSTDNENGEWLGISGRNVTAPEQTWNQILSGVLNSTVGQIIIEIIPDAYDDVEELRRNASIPCGPIPSNATTWEKCNTSPCLFNLAEDPCEYFDKSEEEPLIFQQMMAKFKQYNESSVEPFTNSVNPQSNPAFWNRTWNNWVDYVFLSVSGL